MRINSAAWSAPYPFPAVGWSAIAERCQEMAAEHPEFQHMADIADSVIARRAEDRLAGFTSMHDLVVAARPLPERPPIDVLVVWSPSSGHGGTGGVLIEHRSTTGPDDRIYRPSDQAVPLFWRFVAEKFAFHPVQASSKDEQMGEAAGAGPA
ncbi:hypothetical protein SAMN05192558_106284 [Actinokineospora alba]|uniref:Uncharacterized protein n=1 Tax=Actinokineospora alba TaxID=504798 RepID=A0A1H0PWR9_9PSEU|nr:hypothetical protein [Actinokineospora alba]TDP65959.1 hypothetical protein C8E96_1451 [Actinokineospora alba]SDI61323.1 hypothetical protein SAMN05421871_106168 [Actinokineospora alba]SDP08976.1 hypothetical protein SAMN05192558_106284 [Actinokineospora alba]